MIREAPHEVVRRVCSAVLGDASRCFPVVQPQAKAEFPAVVYAGVARETVAAFEGHVARARILRVDVRGFDYDETVRLADGIREGIQSEGRLRQDLGDIDEYDEAREIWRHIITLSVRY